jgi:hypothetical protein
MLQWRVCEWTERLKNIYTSVKHEEEAGCLSTSIADENDERVCDMILQNRCLTVDEVADQLEISHGSADNIIHKRLVFHEACA